ncbi:MAG: IS110 family RNA-guided transposase [Candidatus Acidiferrales bacterium]
MQQFIGCDAHKRFSVFVAVDEQGRASKPVRIEHLREHYADFLKQLPPESEIAIESTGHWYWMVDEMERAGHHVHLANPMEAKKRMGKTNKTDALDAKGLAILLRNGTLPESWIPPGPLRDQRELLRTRMALRDLRSSLKHRIHAAVDRYGLHTDSISDLFGSKGREYLAARLADFPPETARMVQIQLDALDELAIHIESIEERIHAEITPGPEVQRLRSVPGVGEILAPVIWLEIGNVNRFPRAENLASYAGLVPRVFSSGGHTRLGGISRFVNPYLKWAFVEAANCAVCIQAYRHSHIGCLYQRLLAKRGHGRAVVAVARHLAEASYWILRKQETYRAPHNKLISSRNG